MITVLALNGIGSSSFPAERVTKEIKKKRNIAVANNETVADPKGGENIISAALKEYGRLDILVNNAGIVRDKMIFNMTDPDWDEVIKVHLYGHYYCTRLATKIMRRQKWGRIINISSTAGLGKTLGSSNYVAAKEGIIGFTRAVVRDMVKYNITCNAIRPLAITRHFNQERKEAWLKHGKVQLVKEMERSRLEDVAVFALYLSSEEAVNITGRSFFVGGGTISLYSEPERIRKICRDTDGM